MGAQRYTKHNTSKFHAEDAPIHPRSPGGTSVKVIFPDETVNFIEIFVLNDGDEDPDPSGHDGDIYIWADLS